MKICVSRSCLFVSLPLNVTIEVLGAFTCYSAMLSVSVALYFNILFHYLKLSCVCLRTRRKQSYNAII
jgi:uncharacterized membrane protein